MEGTYEQVRDVLVRYVSPAIADATLQVACKRAKVTPAELSQQHLEALLQEISHGIRLFCPAEKHGEMMLALAKLAE